MTRAQILFYFEVNFVENEGDTQGVPQDDTQDDMGQIRVINPKRYNITVS